MEFIKYSSQKRNCMRWRRGESWPHVLRKQEVCYWLMDKGIDFYTEVEFSAPYSGRADVVALLGRGYVIVEVIATEEELNPGKRPIYPPWEIIKEYANKQFKGLE